MMTDEKALRKSQALEKYQNEQQRRLGGQFSMALGVASGALGYTMSGQFLGIRTVSYRGMVAFGCYYAGLIAAQKLIGDSNFRESYTLDEYQLLKE